MSIEKTLFAAADKMRGAMDAGEYKHIALGLLFLRYVSEAFVRRHALIAKESVILKTVTSTCPKTPSSCRPLVRACCPVEGCSDHRVSMVQSGSMLHGIEPSHPTESNGMNRQ